MNIGLKTFLQPSCPLVINLIPVPVSLTLMCMPWPSSYLSHYLGLLGINLVNSQSFSYFEFALQLVQLMVLFAFLVLLSNFKSLNSTKFMTSRAWVQSSARHVTDAQQISVSEWMHVWIFTWSFGRFFLILYWTLKIVSL